MKFPLLGKENERWESQLHDPVGYAGCSHSIYALLDIKNRMTRRKTLASDTIAPQYKERKVLIPHKLPRERKLLSKG